MAGSPRVAAADVTFPWDGVPVRLARGQVIDVQPGSALETAIGPENLAPLHPRTLPAAQAPAGPAESGTAPDQDTAVSGDEP